MASLRTVLLSAGLCVALGGCLTAEQAARIDAATDARMAQELVAEAGRGAEGSGWVLIDAKVQGHACQDTRIAIVGRGADGRLEHVTSARASHRVSQEVYAPSLPKLKQGEYFVNQISCKFGRNTSNYKSNYAKFTVNAGEFVNVGRIDLSYKSDGFFSLSGDATKHWSPIDEDVKEQLKRQFPLAMAKLIERRMTMNGPAEMRMGQR